MKDKIEQINTKIEELEYQISDLESSKRILELYRFQLRNPNMNCSDWSDEAENILKSQ